MTDVMREALEKIAGQREYDPKDHERAAKYKRDEGVWTTDEYLADAALAAPQALAATPAVGGEPTVDAVRKTIADEWGSHICWQEGAYGLRTCDKDKHCRCADLARAILNTHSLAALPASPLRGREIELRAALERSVIAIDDWLQTYAADLCDPVRVEEASKRIGEYGTLSYIAHVQQQNRAALSAPPPEQPAADPVGDIRMSTINGRRVKLLKEEGHPIGRVCEWKPESDWMKVITDDGVTYMVHCTDKIEILPYSTAPAAPEPELPKARPMGQS